MKKSKLLLLSLTTLLAGITLASCVGGGTKPGTGDKGSNSDQSVIIKEGFTDIRAKNTDEDVNKPLIEKNGKKYYQVAGLEIEVKDTLNTLYVQDVHNDDKFNYLKGGHSESADIYASMVDGLFDNTKSKRLVGMLAVAEKLDTTNPEKPTYSFQIRQNVPWVVNETGEIYEIEGVKQYIKAEDFVESAFYNLTVQGTNVFLFNLFIDGAEEFNAWALSDENIGKTEEEKRAKFAELVGVYTTGDDVISYRLKENIPYFKTVTTYSPYYPVNRHYLKKQGSNFGNSENHILVSGAYRITKYTKQVEYVYETNEHYWDKEHVYIKTINNKYIKSGQSADYTRNAFENGEIDSFTVVAADKIGWDKYIGEGNSVRTPKSDLVTPLESFGTSTFFNYFKFNRSTFEYNGLTPKTDEQKQATAQAIKNKDFRLGFLHGFDYVQTRRISRKNPEETVYRRYVAEGLALDPDGKDYVQYFDEIYNKENGSSVNLSGFENGFDPVFDREKAKQNFKKAYDALKAANVTLPIVMDVSGSLDIIGKQELINRMKLLEEIANEAVDGSETFLTIRLNYPQNDSQQSAWQNSQNFDFGYTGWGPDYADPRTYLDTILINGDYAEHLGLKYNPNKLSEGNNQQIHDLAQEILGSYDKAVKAAYKLTDPKARFKALAQAEYDLIYKDGIIHPFYRAGGVSPSVSRIINFQAAKVAYGNNSARMKNVVVAKEVLPRADKLKIIREFNILTGKQTEQVTINLYNNEGTLFDDTKYIGIPEAITLAKDSNIKLPEGINKEERKIVRKWYTNQQLTDSVVLNHGVFKATTNAYLYGKVEDLAAITNLGLEIAQSDRNFAKGGQVDESFEYPIFADSDKLYELDYKDNIEEASKDRADYVEVEVLPADEKSEKDVAAAKVLKGGLAVDKDKHKIFVQYPKASEDPALLGAKVLVKVKGENHKETDGASSVKTLKLFLAGITTSYEQLFEGDSTSLIKHIGSLQLETQLQTPDLAQLTEDKLTNLKAGVVRLQLTFTHEKLNQIVRVFEVEVSKQVANRLNFRSEELNKIDLNEKGKTLKFESSNTEAASFENGVLTLKQVGQEVTITVKEGEQVHRQFTIQIISAFVQRGKQILSITKQYAGDLSQYTQETKQAFEQAHQELEQLLTNWQSSDEVLEPAVKKVIDTFNALKH